MTNRLQTTIDRGGLELPTQQTASREEFLEARRELGEKIAEPEALKAELVSKHREQGRS